MPTDTRLLLDEVYREFSAEAKALLMELGARYGIRETIQVNGVSGEAYLRWHQVDDLLTVYYFNLCGNFRHDVLKNNSASNGKFHCGVDLQPMIKDPEDPTKKELKDMRDNVIRPLFNEVMPVLANAILRGELGAP
jgi:hypothetical protein